VWAGEGGEGQSFPSVMPSIRSHWSRL
jgi:hypothetical protein